MNGMELNKQRAMAGRFAWLGMLAVVLFQLQVALHPQGDHNLFEITDEACELCLNLNEVGEAPCGDALSWSPALRSSAATDVLTTSESTGAFSPYGARAPPLS